MIWEWSWLPVLSQNEASVAGMAVALSWARRGSEPRAGTGYLLTDCG